MQDHPKTEIKIKQIMPCTTDMWAVFKEDDGSKFSSRIVCLALHEITVTHRGHTEVFYEVVGMDALDKEISDVTRNSNFLDYSPVQVEQPPTKASL